MSLFDFNKLNRPTGGAKPTNPLEIFRSAPALAGSVNDLWQGQSKALESWHSNRTEKDILISLHTGAGKSIVGALAAQSLVNEGMGHVLYVCATNDLVIQISKEVRTKLGLEHSTRISGEFSNDLYETGQGFCITNYQALFNGRSIFLRDLRPDAILFDDAHVAEKIIRDCYTLKIDKNSKPDLFHKLLSLFEPHFQSVHKSDMLKAIMSGDSVYKLTLIPPSAIVSLSKSGTLTQILRDHEIHRGETGFSFEHLSDHFHCCTAFISQTTIEIAPTFLPSRRISFLNDRNTRRVYLSATLTSEVDFCRAFGRKPSVRIEPESDAGMGERLIVLADREMIAENSIKGVKDDRTAQALARNHKLLISTSSYASAAKYKALASPPPAAEFTQSLETFRNQTDPGAFILVGRIDGIDLPHATCRVMMADSLPLGFSLSENFQYDVMEMRNSFSAKLANRITQLFGRTNRGRNDFSVIFITDKRFKAWLSTPRNIALLPELLRKQIGLGKSLVDQLKITDINSFSPLASQVISRDPGWLSFYKDFVGAPDLTEQEKLQATDTDRALTEAALAEAEFAAFMWDNVPSRAREAIGAVVDKVVTSDRRLAGWYNIQIGHTFELEGDGEAAAKQYAEGMARSNYILPLQMPSSFGSLARDHEARNPLHLKLLDIFSNDIRIQNDKIDRYSRLISPLFDNKSTSNQKEEAARALGDLIGMSASRPEQESEDPSTLDVLWVSHNNEAILIELKTEKSAESPINSDDVGQIIQNTSWTKEKNQKFEILGSIIIGGKDSKSREAAADESMWKSKIDIFESFFKELIETLRSLQRMSPIERYSEINSLVERAEWKAPGISQRLRGIQIVKMPVN